MPELRFRELLLCLCCCALVTGCAGSDGDALLNPTPDTLEGTWQYTISNAYESVFTGCTGDAAVLEGLSFAQGTAVAPLCRVANTFEVVSSGDAWSVVPHDVQCTDGSIASMSGTGSVSGGSLAGQWYGSSNQGVESQQPFSGPVTSGTFEVTESSYSFEGSFAGSCELSPPLRGTVHLPF